MLKIAIVGCGKIADSHAEEISRIDGSMLHAAVDAEPLMARQFADRHGATSYFSSLDEMFADTKPDVVHITTPPATHFSIAKHCLEQGCHVFVEKPFTVTETEAVELVDLATTLGLKMTVGNDVQFTHASSMCRRLVESGYLGGNPVHMESHYCYQMQGAYAEAMLADKEHWVRKLPGQLLHNIISHGIVRIAEHLADGPIAVDAVGMTSPLLKSLGEHTMIDELRAIVTDQNGTTAYFTFSSQMAPSLHQFRIFGPRNGLVVDDDEHSVIRLRGTRYKSYAQKFLPGIALAWQHGRGSLRNIWKFLRGDFHMKHGMRQLFETFYRAIEHDTEPPIPYRQIVLTCAIMDQIFEQVYRGSAELTPHADGNVSLAE